MAYDVQVTFGVGSSNVRINQFSDTELAIRGTINVVQHGITRENANVVIRQLGLVTHIGQSVVTVFAESNDTFAELAFLADTATMFIDGGIDLSGEAVMLIRDPFYTKRVTAGLDATLMMSIDGVEQETLRNATTVSCNNHGYGLEEEDCACYESIFSERTDCKSRK